MPRRTDGGVDQRRRLPRPRGRGVHSEPFSESDRSQSPTPQLSCHLGSKPLTYSRVALLLGCVITGFADRRTKDLFARERVKGLSAEIQRAALRKPLIIDAAAGTASPTTTERGPHAPHPCQPPPPHPGEILHDEFLKWPGMPAGPRRSRRSGPTRRRESAPRTTVMPCTATTCRRRAAPQIFTTDQPPSLSFSAGGRASGFGGV
jgi:hypothetical protein